MVNFQPEVCNRPVQQGNNAWRMKFRRIHLFQPSSQHRPSDAFRYSRPAPLDYRSAVLESRCLNTIGPSPFKPLNPIIDLAVEGYFFPLFKSYRGWLLLLPGSIPARLISKAFKIHECTCIPPCTYCRFGPLCMQLPKPLPNELTPLKGSNGISNPCFFTKQRIPWKGKKGAWLVDLRRLLRCKVGGSIYATTWKLEEDPKAHYLYYAGRAT
jgi:hypothetical protein